MIRIRMGSEFERVEQPLIERFRVIPVANVSDSMSRLNAGGPRIRPYHKHGLLIGPALTVRTRPGDNLALHKALDMAKPGDVIVVDGGGDLTNALLGDLLVAYALKLGVGGFVVNGSIRDLATIREGTFPVYAAGVTHRGPYKDGPGEINGPIAVDGMSFRPGDLVIGDADGVLCVPREEARSICEQAERKNQAEQRDLADILGGTWDRRWIEEKIGTPAK